LVGEDLCAVLLRFGFVDIFHEHTLVLEDVTLRLLVKRVVATYFYQPPALIRKTSSPTLTDACQFCPLLCISSAIVSALSVSASKAP
jgi:hypothetical protein